MEVVVKSGDVAEFLRGFQPRPPDVALIEHGLTDGREGGDALSQLRQWFPEVRAIVLASENGIPMPPSAWGFVNKRQADIHVVVNAVDRIARGERFFPSTAFDLQLGPSQARSPLSELTSREREVLGFVAMSVDNLRIAAHLGVTERTVRAHVSNLYRKLDVENRSQMVLTARRLGVALADRF